MPNRKFKKNGFTLIELIVTIAIFSIIVGAIIGVFIFGVRQQRMTLVYQTILDQISYSLEYMSRSLRMAKKDTGENCFSNQGLNYEIPNEYLTSQNSGTGIKFINVLENSECQEFFFKEGQLWKKSKEEIFPLTSNKIEVVSVRFDLAGESEKDKLQPSVKIFLEIRGKGELEGLRRIKIQTTISQRNLDVEYY